MQRSRDSHLTTPPPPTHLRGPKGARLGARRGQKVKNIGARREGRRPRLVAVAAHLHIHRAGAGAGQASCQRRACCRADASSWSAQVIKDVARREPTRLQPNAPAADAPGGHQLLPLGGGAIQLHSSSVCRLLQHCLVVTLKVSIPLWRLRKGTSRAAAGAAAGRCRLGEWVPGGWQPWRMQGQGCMSVSGWQGGGDATNSGLRSPRHTVAAGLRWSAPAALHAPGTPTTPATTVAGTVGMFRR